MHQLVKKDFDNSRALITLYRLCLAVSSSAIRRKNFPLWQSRNPSFLKITGTAEQTVTYLPFYSVECSGSAMHTALNNFIFCWPHISVHFVLTTNLTHFFNVLISLLYMFRAIQCSSSGESIVSMHHLVYITPFWPAYQTATYPDWYTGCPRRIVPDFGRVFLMLKYTDITQNTYVQSWTVTEIMAREVWNFDSCYTLIDYQIHMKTGRNMWFL